MKLSKRWPGYLWLPGAVISIYVFVSYLLLPATWARIEHEPGLSKRPMVTSTAQGIPGDAINIGLIGTKEDVVSAFHSAGWYPADPKSHLINRQRVLRNSPLACSNQRINE